MQRYIGCTIEIIYVVEVVLLVPDPEANVLAFRGMDIKKFFGLMEALCRYENFTLVGIAGPNEQGMRRNISHPWKDHANRRLLGNDRFLQSTL